MYESFRNAGREALRASWHELRRNYAGFSRRGCKAKIIAVTGSSAKSTTVALLAHILSATAKVKTQVMANCGPTTWKTLTSVSPEHDFVVLELGTNTPGALPRMARIVLPDIAIITMVGLEHYSAFRTKDAVAKEKASLVESLQPSGLAILNKDDPHVMAMSSLTKGGVATFGEIGANYSIHNIRPEIPGRLRLSIVHDGDKLDVTTRLTGAHNSLAVAAAFTCAHQLGVPPAVCRDRIASFAPIFGRCSVHTIKNGPIFIVDTGKAPYYSIHIPINMMTQFRAPRKRIVIGQMSDAGNTNPKYRDLYRASRLIADQVIFVGENAHRSKATAAEISEGRFVEKRTVKDAATFLKETAVPGEVILLKSAPSLHLERVLLNFWGPVRCWEHACKKKCQCITCGLYELPFGEHPN